MYHTNRDLHINNMQRRRRRRPSPTLQCMLLLCAAAASHSYMSAEAFTHISPSLVQTITPAARHAYIKQQSRQMTHLSKESESDDVSAAAAHSELDDDPPATNIASLISIPSSIKATSTSRRDALMQMVAMPSAIVLASATASTDRANAARPEIDSKSGVLFSPKAKMLGGGGSDAARGIEIRDRTTDTAQQQRRNFAKSVGLIQPVYSVRFVAYLSRFILNFDPAARSWWLEEARELSAKDVGSDAATMAEQLRFAEFAESVEVGLADYFVGPYGSYASLEAIKAGMNAKAPATSGGIFVDSGNKFDVAKLLGVGKKEQTSTLGKKKLMMTEVKQKRQGIKNLLTLLKARYTSLGAKNQLAILFSLIEDPKLQPTKEIQGLLGEADNASVTTLELIGQKKDDDVDFRLSSRRGGGYAIDSRLDVTIEPPPALGQEYRCAKIEPIMRPTSRVLKINVLDGGSGYQTPPTVTVVQKGIKRQCDAVAILDRYGSVESILVLDPGYGYGGTDRRGPTEPIVQISPPKANGKQAAASEEKMSRQATAEAELEYAIKEIKIEDHGSGYAASQPPKITISPCEQDPEWFVSPMTYRAKQGGVAGKDEFLRARVTSMALGYYNTTIDTRTDAGIESYFDTVDPTVIGRVAGDSLSLLPTTVRPQLSPVFDRYVVPDLPPIPEDQQGIALPSQKYRAIDPIFGGVGSKPVTIGAKDLTVSEYTRLALSGAVCTVLVRTLLNPLELVKTKIQLRNDEELLGYAASALSKSPQKEGKEAAGNDTEAMLVADKSSVKSEEEEEEDAAAKIGTFDLITSLIKLRGPLSLFQSADITFLASLVFGSLGFGATELFRRFFTNAIFEDSSGGGTGEELVLLGAAALACVLTSLAATPFEMIRVQSMGKIEAQGWTKVLAYFLAEKRSGGKSQFTFIRGGTGALPSNSTSSAVVQAEHAEFGLRDIKKDDLKPLFSGFKPIVSRELPFAITKFLVFDLLAKALMALLNAQGGFAEPIQVGVGPVGLTVSAAAGAIAGIAGAIISHPADLILTLTSSSNASKEGEEAKSSDWRPLIKELLEKDGGIANLFAGLPARATFFFLVIGLQFFLYDFVKGLFSVSSDDLTLVLDVFYAIRQGLVDA